jgi:hypothetical protein
MEYGLRRFWFEFEVLPYQPASEHEISLDGPDSWSPQAPIRMGVGVTGIDEEDCRNLVERLIFDGQPLPPVRRVVADVDVSALGERVLPNMEVPIRRGIWFPMGFSETRSR